MRNKNSRIKTIKDRQLPDAGKIGRHMNFDRVFNDYALARKLMISKTVLLTGGAVVLAGLAGLTLMTEEKPVIGTQFVANEMTRPFKPFIQPPLPGKNVAYAVYRISAKEGGVLNYPTGSRITVPPNAFRHRNGDRVSDSVDIHYREFHTPADIFLSGIPMEYDSAGMTRTFESAGMLEIRAWDQGEELEVVGQSPIDIMMASANGESRFNLYELDTVKRNWVYRGKDKIIDPEKPVIKNSGNSRHQASKTTALPIPPALADAARYSFSIKFDPGNFPELEPYHDIRFEVTDDAFKSAYYKVTWKQISLHCGDQPGIYIVKLAKADTVISVKAKPVFEQKNFEEATRIFESRMEAANRMVDARESEIQKAVDRTEAQLVNYSSRKFVESAFKNAGVSVNFRNFSVRSLGIHNIDYPMASELSYAYRLVGELGKKNLVPGTGATSYNDIFLIVKGRNAVLRFPKVEPVRFNPRSKVLMWTVTNNSQIAFFRINDYGKLVNGGENNVSPEIAPDQDLAVREIRDFPRKM